MEAQRWPLTCVFKGKCVRLRMGRHMVKVQGCREQEAPSGPGISAASLGGGRTLSKDMGDGDIPGGPVAKAACPVQGAHSPWSEN